MTKTVKYYYVNGRRVAERSSTGGLRYYHQDHLSSSVVISDSSGNMILRTSYAPYGSTAYSQGSAVIKYQYTDQEKDGSGLYYYGARYYDPELGRFISPDSYLDGLNRYAYCGNNPICYYDPTGHYFGWDDALAGLIGGTWNLISQACQGNINSWSDAGVAFAGGAISGIGGLYPQFGGWAWGGAAVGAANAYLGGQNIWQGALIGAASGLAGGYIGSLAGPLATSLLPSASPVLTGAIGGLAGGAAGGFAGGFVAGLIGSGGDFGAAVQAGLNGALTGGVIGGASGAWGGYQYAKANNLNPWTGESITATIVGDTQPFVAPDATVPTRGENTVAQISETPLTDLEYTPKVIKQINKDTYHGFPSLVDVEGNDLAIRTLIQGGDGIFRTKVTVPGVYGGHAGYYTYIIEPDGVTCNHRFFEW